METTIVRWSEAAEGRYRVAAHRTGLNSVNLLNFLLLFSCELVLCLNGTDAPTGHTFHPTDDKWKNSEQRSNEAGEKIESWRQTCTKCHLVKQKSHMD